MTTFVRRFMGVLTLEPAVFEEIEADWRSGLQSILVVLLVCAASGVATLNLGVSGLAGFSAGAIVALSGWLIWITVVTLLGTRAMPEAATRSSTVELLRTLGFATAPGVFVAFAAIRTAAPLVLVVVAAWMFAAEVVATRQALDYRSTSRAVAVSLLGWVVSIIVIAAVAAMLSTRVG